MKKWERQKNKMMKVKILNRITYKWKSKEKESQKNSLNLSLIQKKIN